MFKKMCFLCVQNELVYEQEVPYYNTQGRSLRVCICHKRKKF